MIKKILFQFWAVLLLCILLNACWPYKVEKHLIDQESKDYCLFGKGSYWIYQDSTTLAIDSVVFNNIEYIYSEVEEEYNFHIAYETFNIVISSCSQNDQKEYLAHLAADVSTGLTLLGFQQEVAVYHNANIGLRVFRLKFVEKKDVYLLNTTTFNNVKVFEFYNNHITYPLEKRYYWAKHIGLIRIEVYENESLISVRNLIRYNVKPYKQ